MPAAKLCRFCGATLAEPAPALFDPMTGTFEDRPTARPPEPETMPAEAEPITPDIPLLAPPPSTPALKAALIGGAVLIALVVAVVIGLLARPATETARDPARAASVAAASDLPTEPALTPLAAGETIEWAADTADEQVERQVGAMQVRITRVGEDDAVAPRLTITQGGASIVLDGERVGRTFTHSISAVQVRPAAPPVLMLQSFTGGAHCCTHIQLAGWSGGKLRLLDLGSWDGEAGEPPTDVSGDGFVDFVFVDQAFLYAFASYAGSRSVPKVLNVVGGKVVDVSGRPAFRPVFLKAMREQAEDCRSGADGETRNAACAAYVAAAARVGRIGPAWRDMLVGYDAVAAAALDSEHQSYPEALAAFLKTNGYVPKSWSPPPPPLSPPEPMMDEDPDAAPDV